VIAKRLSGLRCRSTALLAQSTDKGQEKIKNKAVTNIINKELIQWA